MTEHQEPEEHDMGTTTHTEADRIDPEVARTLAIATTDRWGRPLAAAPSVRLAFTDPAAERQLAAAHLHAAIATGALTNAEASQVQAIADGDNL